MRFSEIFNLTETEATGIIEPIAPSESRPASHQFKSEPKQRYQGVKGDSRWQTPPKRREPTAPVPMT
ncbi:hypothetical protein [Methylobacterium sp. Leaf466]|uniref:hypothetical protein n=1 Tax=Methylobacterium sp. Leaf466 TaxID=1736386 RepID=UPI0012E3E59B|nr:hypothetical protein [Methylobacterium sp. Leaf466]